MKLLVRLFFALVLMLCPAIMTGCGSSYISEEDSREDIEREAEEEAQEEDVMAESEEGDESEEEE